VLNRNREIVFGNRAALRLAGFASLPVALGLQLCEAFHCIHATQSPDFCQTGGGAETASGECHIVGSLGGEEAACDLMVTASPVKGPEGLVVCTLTDFTPEKQRRAIERQFFHDILNIAGGVNGCAAILKDELKGDTNAELAGLMDQCAAELLSEIRGQQQLLGAEVGQLAVRRAWLRTLELVQTAAAEYRNRADSKGRTILVDPLSADLRMETDPAILSRVLGNMLKNALEATQPGGTVTIGCAASQGGIEFCVHDRGVIPQGDQTQVFQRSFSSKGSGRAVRNYSIKLMTERYLGGTIRFESSPLQGTRFIAHYPMASPIDAS
jgi:signal transduction histidine kinase